MENKTDESNKKCHPSVAEYYKQYTCKKDLKLTTLHSHDFKVDDRYQILEKIGQGAYGIVVAAVDSHNNQNKSIAMKKTEKAFEQRIYTKRTLREIKLLRLLEHDNIIAIDQILLPNSREEFEDIYITNTLMETDLQQIIKSPQPITADHVKFFIYQLLRGLKFIHSAGVIHRDLKPRNLLVNSNCDLKICDFGLARTVNTEKAKKQDELTDYVTTRWYRAPELLLARTDYTEGVDVWSVGIIFAELMKRKTLLPGNDSSDQLAKIFELIGTPNQDEIKSIPYEEYRNFLKQLPKRPSKDFANLFPKASKEAIDLLKRMLVFDLDKRISVTQALEHPYLAELHLPEDEPKSHPIPPMEFEFEKYGNLTRQQYKDLVYEEILLYHFPDFKENYLQKVKNGVSVCEHIAINENKNVIDPDDFYDEEENNQ